MNFEFDVSKIEEVLNDFYAVTGIKTVIFGSDYSVITAVPFKESAFCNAMNVATVSSERCHECTMNAVKNCKEKMIYHCHAGLVEAVAPIRMHDITIGYIMLGQVLKEGSDKEKIISYAKDFIGDDAYLLNEIKVKGSEEIHAAVRLMESCVCYLLMNKFIHEENGNIIFEICKYIEENPDGDLQASALCDRFKINRNYLYKLSNTYLGMPIAEYIRLKRLRYAENLIKEGYSVTRAAEYAGFYDYGYFGKIFKKHLGKTPTEIKKSQTK